MVTLNNPITSQNIVDRFEELVTDVADHHIVWGTDNLPGHSSFTASDFGGVVDGFELTLTGVTGTYSVGETVNSTITATTGIVVSYSSNVLKLRTINPGAGQTGFIQNDIISGTSSGAVGTVNTLAEISAVSIGITGTSVGSPGSLITANQIYSTLKNEMNNYTNIKNTNAVVNMTGAGQQYSDTQIAHLTTGQRTTLNPSQPSSLQPGQVIDDTNLEGFMTTLANAYSTERGNTYTLTKTICHSSCHSSCHGSRGRR
jgi:hypothetical protein